MATNAYSQRFANKQCSKNKAKSIISFKAPVTLSAATVQHIRQ